MRRWRDIEITRHHKAHSWVFECLTCGQKVVSTNEDHVYAEAGVHGCRPIRDTDARV